MMPAPRITAPALASLWLVTATLPGEDAGDDGGAAALLERPVVTVAGTGDDAFGRAVGRALEVAVAQPFGVEIGPDEALYICEVGNHRVFRLDLGTGDLRSVAGTGERGYAGDGGPAVRAQLDEPYEVRFDAAGDLYFVEMRNAVVRCVEMRSGRIRTVAGTGEPGFGGDGGPATAARLRQPHSIAFDRHGALYIADIGNHRIRRVDRETGVIETIAGNGERRPPTDGAVARGASMLGPRALHVLDDTLWIALREGNSVWTLDLVGGRLRHVAGDGEAGYRDGPGAEARFSGPKGIVATAAGRVLVVDTENQVIREVDAATGTVRTVAGVGPQGRGFNGEGVAALRAHFDRPHGICVRGSLVFVGDTNNHRVRRFALPE